MWASVDGAIVVGLKEPRHHLPRSAVRFKTFESRGDSAYGDKRNDHTGSEQRDVTQREAQRGTSVTSADGKKQQHVI